MGAHGRHSHIRAHAEQAQTNNQQNRANSKGDQFRGGEVNPGCQGQYIDDGRNGQGGKQRLQNFGTQFLQFTSPVFLHNHTFYSIITQKPYTAKA